MFYAELYNHVVRGIFEGPILPLFPWPWRAVDVTALDPRPAAGDVYSETTGEFSTPTPPTRYYRLRNLWELLTEAEQEDIVDSAAKKAKLFLFNVRMDVAVKGGTVIAILSLMQTAGIIDAARKSELQTAMGG